MIQLSALQFLTGKVLYIWTIIHAVFQQIPKKKKKDVNIKPPVLQLLILFLPTTERFKI